MVEAKNLGKSKAIEKNPSLKIKPHVKIQTEIHTSGKKPKPFGNEFQTRVAQPAKATDKEMADIRKFATWRSKQNPYDPTGHTINLGEFSKNVRKQNDESELKGMNTMALSL